MNGPKIGLVFVQDSAKRCLASTKGDAESKAGCYAPRVIRTGVARYDFTEVLEGIEEGEQVVLVKSAELQKQQRDARAQAAARAGGPLGGGNPQAGVPGGNPGGGNPGGGRGGGGNPGGGGGGGGGGRGGRGGGN